MEFRTVVPLPKKIPPLQPEQRILLLGSCFSEHLGAALQRHHFQVDLNPFGILYNPASIAAALQRILTGTPFQAEELFFYQERWHSRMHHGDFSAPTAEEALTRINGRLLPAHEAMAATDWLMITFGTSYVYREKEQGGVVANCHKLPEKFFSRSRLSVEEIVEEYSALIKRLLALRPTLKLLFTVSPIRHLRDGLHANQLSKATLLLAIDALQERFPESVFYFPSYEIVNDELRDYRFYAEDMLHPSPTTVSYLWERFGETFFSPETQQFVQEVERVSDGLAHRPIQPDSEATRRFLSNLEQSILELSKKYRTIDFQNELKLCRARLNKSQN